MNALVFLLVEDLYANKGLKKLSVVVDNNGHTGNSLPKVNSKNIIIMTSKLPSPR